MSETEKTTLDDFEYTLTRRALRQIRAEAWDEGATKASPHGGGYLRSLLIENPHRLAAHTPPAVAEGSNDPVWPHTGEPIDRRECDSCGVIVADCGGDEMLGWSGTEYGWFCDGCGCTHESETP